MSTTIPDSACLGCGCLCDDIELELRGDQIVSTRNACSIGEAWFRNTAEDTGLRCAISGQEADRESALDRAAEILANARYPLVYGLSELTTESQRAVLTIADLIGACVDTSAAAGNGPFVLAMQEVGEVTCTLGEIKNRSDLLLLWGCDPSRTHPRHFERYSLHAKGRFMPASRAGRYAVAIHSGDVESDSDAAVDEVISIRAGSDFECFWTLRALAKGITIDPDRVERITGVSLTNWQSLMDRMKRANYGAILFDRSLSARPDGRLRSQAMLALVREMNAHARFVCVPLGAAGNGVGAENVMTWTTGYPFAVSLASGYPTFHPGDHSAEFLLNREEADAVLIVGATDLTKELSPAARKHLSTIKTIVLDHRMDTSRNATVEFRTSNYGIHSRGTVYRSDHVPIPLRPAVATTLSDATVILRSLEARIRSIRDASRTVSGMTA